MLLTEIPLFVYGTLRSNGPNSHLIKPYVNAIRQAQVGGSLHHVDYLDENGNPAHTVTYSPEGDARIEGELQTLAPLHRLNALAQLDRLELNFGLAGTPEDPSPRQTATCVFVRQLILVRPDGEPPQLAWTYVLTNAQEVAGPEVLADTDGIVRYTPRPAHALHLSAHTALAHSA